MKKLVFVLVLLLFMSTNNFASCQEASIIAYRHALETLYNNQVLPDDTKLDYDAKFFKMEDNSFSVSDVNGDGEKELIFIWNSPIVAEQLGFVFAYGNEKKDVREILRVYPAMTFYDNKYVKVLLSHNQGNNPKGYWPYDLYQYDNCMKEYVFIKEVADGNKNPIKNIGTELKIKYLKLTKENIAKVK